MTRLKVVAVSTNANSFGLKQMVMIGNNKKGYEACANAINLLQQGDVIVVPDNQDPIDRFIELGFELGRELSPPPSDALVNETFFPLTLAK